MRDTNFLLQEGIQAGQFGDNGKPHGEHAMGFVRFPNGPAFTGKVVDLGAGAGLPGLILAEAFPETTWLLVERRTSRAEMLTRGVHRLGLTDRVTVSGDDARLVGWSQHRGTADWVTARSFGPPALTAEMAAPLLRPAGFLLVSEPHDTNLGVRWPTEALRRCGLVFDIEWTTNEGRYLRFQRSDEDLARLPRKGASKKPLFSS